MHLLTNLMVQIFLGIPLELVHKFWRIGLIYVLGVMCGALLFFVVDCEKPVYLAGASGGVYTLLSAHVANVIINWSEMEFNWLRSGLLLTFIGADVGTVVYQVFFSEKATQVSIERKILISFIFILGVARLAYWRFYRRHSSWRCRAEEFA